MKKWQEWNTNVAGAFPHLAKLLIAGCPELTNQTQKIKSI
jgi:hypothetical protein